MEHVDPTFDTWESSTRGGPVGPAHGVRGRRLAARRSSNARAARRCADNRSWTRSSGTSTTWFPAPPSTFNGKAWLDYWTGDPWTLGSYAAFAPGADDEVLGLTAIPVDRVHFAGEHTSTYSQGFLNGGVESGQRAAIEVMRAIGAHVPAAARQPA